MSNKLILVAYKFPPYDGIGSYRWMKMSKFLASRGFEIHVITVNWKNIGNLNLLKEVEHPNIHIHVIPNIYPFRIKYFLFKSKLLNFLKSIPFRLLIDRVFFFDDETRWWGIHLVPKVEELMKKLDTNLVIVTGAPFQSIRWMHLLKLKNKDMFLIQDYRDQWAFNPNLNYSARKLEMIKKWQTETVASADRVVAVSQILLDDFVLRDDPKGVVISNGFEHFQADFNFMKRNLSSSKLVLCHAGSISNGRDVPLFHFFDFLEKCPDIAKGFKILLIGSMGVKTFSKIKYKYPNLYNNSVVEIIGKIPQDQVFKFLQKSNFGLLLNASNLPYALSTKIFEYGMLKVPCFSLNYGGEIESLIQNCDLGVSVNLNKISIEDGFKELCNSTRTYKMNVEEYSFENLAEKYSQVILSGFGTTNSN